eukprot:SAG11_NODE_1413_length_4981_cov_2.208726_5_plen_163_part_00
MLPQRRWFVDSSERAVFYSAEKNETLHHGSEMIFIATDGAIIAGDSALRDVKFESLAFEHGYGWLGPNAGRCGAQFGLVGYHTRLVTIDVNWGSGKDCIMWNNQSEDCWRMPAPVPAAVYFNASHSITFHSCAVRATGASGIWCDAGSQHCVVNRSTFTGGT